jgi:hypothetical protein
MSSQTDSHDSVPVRVARALEAAARRPLQSGDLGRTEEPDEPDASQSDPRYIAGDRVRLCQSQIPRHVRR